MLSLKEMNLLKKTINLEQTRQDINNYNKAAEASGVDQFVVELQGLKENMSWENLDVIKGLFLEKGLNIDCNPANSNYSILFTPDNIECLRKILDVYEQVLANYSVKAK